MATAWNWGRERTAGCGSEAGGAWASSEDTPRCYLELGLLEGEQVCQVGRASAHRIAELGPRDLEKAPSPGP